MRPQSLALGGREGLDRVLHGGERRSARRGGFVRREPQTSRVADDPDFLEAGFACASLIADPKRWINRRVETVEMLSQEETRRRVSIDFTLSAEQRRRLRTRHGLTVPISVLRKQPLRNFDLRDEDTAARPVLGRADNRELALIALLSAARDALGDAPPDESIQTLTAELRQIVFHDEPLALAALESLVEAAAEGDRLRAAVWEDARVSQHAAHAGRRLRAVRGAAARRARPARREVQLRRGLPARAAVGAAPGQVRARRAAAGGRATPTARGFSSTARRRGGRRASTWRSRSPRTCASHAPSSGASGTTAAATIAGLGAAPTATSTGPRCTRPTTIAPHDDVRAYVEIVSEREGPASRAALTALAVSALLWLGWLSGLDASRPGAAVSLLLAGGAVVSGFVAATGHHIIVDKILRSRRRALVLVAACALAASACLAMEVPDAQAARDLARGGYPLHPGDRAPRLVRGPGGQVVSAMQSSTHRTMSKHATRIRTNGAYVIKSAESRPRAIKASGSLNGRAPP